VVIQTTIVNYIFYIRFLVHMKMCKIFLLAIVYHIFINLYIVNNIISDQLLQFWYLIKIVGMCS